MVVLSVLEKAVLRAAMMDMKADLSAARWEYFEA
jgi:hypothetical protein